MAIIMVKVVEVVVAVVLVLNMSCLSSIESLL